MDETFKIENDKTAEWALKKVKESEDERDRLITLAEEEIKDLEDRINELKEKCNNDTGFLKSCLKMYFETVPHKATKTQESYKLLSGTLVYKKPSAKIIHDDEALIKALDGTEYVEIKRSLKWGDYKKNLTIEKDKVLDTTTGEVIDACKVETVPGDFSIKF
jgi:hypothetical protein